MRPYAAAWVYSWVCVDGLGFAEVGVDEVELFGSEEALGLLVTGGLKFGVEGLAEDDHLHQIAYSIAGVAHREVEQGKFGLGFHRE